MAGVNRTKERGRVTGVDLVVLRGNHVYMLEKLNAPQLVNELYQNEVIDQDDITIITKEHDKGRKQGVEQMLKIIHESGPKAFAGFVKSLRMAGFTDMADRLHEEHRSGMLQQVETQEPKIGNFKQLTDEFERQDEEVKGLAEKVQFLERRSNDVSDKCTRLEEGDKNKQKYIREINKKLEEGDKMKEKEIREINELNKKLVERVCVLEGRSSDKFNFAKLSPIPRINTDGINTDERKTVKGFIRRKKDLNTDGRKTVEVIAERCEDWERKMKVWVKNRKDCLYKLLKWWEGEQYKNVDEFKRDVKEWRDVLYKCLFSKVEMYDSCIEWRQFICSLPDCLYDNLPASLYVSLYGIFMLKSKDDLYTLIDVYKQQQDEVKVEIEQCINRLDQIISDEGKDNTGTSSKDNTGASSKDNTGASSKDNKFCICFSDYEVDLTSAQTNFVRIYKHLKL